MSVSVVTRSGKGSALAHAELDANFTDLAAAVNFLLPQSVAYAAAIPLTGNLYMPQQSVSGALTFTVAAGAQIGARTYLRLVANGTNVPAFAGFKEWGGSAGYDNRAGIVNSVEFFYDGTDYWYYISQAVGATAVDSVAPTASSAVVQNATPTTLTIAMSEALDPAYTPASSAFAVSGHTVSAASISGASIVLTVNAFTNGEAARTFSYTQPGTNNARDMAGNLLASFSGLAITNNVNPAATAPGAPTIGTATAGAGQATVTFTAPASNGGSAITSYTVTSSPGGITASGSASPITVTGLTNGTAYTFTVTATNAIGTSSASSASNSVTPASASYPQMVTLNKMAQTGSGPYIYTGSTAGALNGNEGDTVSKMLPSGVDGHIVIQVHTMAGQGSNEVLMGFDVSATALTTYANFDYLGIPRAPANNIAFYTNASSIGAGTGVPAVNDWFKIARAGSVLTYSMSKDSGATWTTVREFTGVSTADRYFHIGCAFAGSFTLIETVGLAA